MTERIEPEPPRPPKQEKQPASDEVVEIAPGVLRLQLPISLPGLGHVNCYALEDRRGVALVDPGLPGRASWAALVARLADAGLPLGRVHTVVVTHSHPDHYGGATRVRSVAGAAIAASRHFNTWGRTPCLHAEDDDGDGDGDGDGDDGAGGARGTHSHGGTGPPWARPTPWGGGGYSVPLKRRVAYRLSGTVLGTRWSPPAPTHCVRDGEALSLGGRDFFARHTPGHTVDHLCLHDPEGGLLLSGDHVLPTITPHIPGVTADPDPLASFVRSLDAVAALPDIHLVLPAHGQPFDDLPGRVHEIKAHHDERLEMLVEAGRAGWADVGELSHAIFRPRSWGSMAESEAYAHLEHLRLADRMERRSVDGHQEFRTAPA